MSSLNRLLAKNDFLPSPLKKTYVVSRFLSLLLWLRMPQDLLDLIETRQRVLNPLNEEFSIFMELLGYLSIKEEEREFQKCSSQFSSVQLLSHIRLFITPFTAASQASLSITNSWSLLKLMSIELVMPSNHLILCYPLLLLLSIFPSFRVFSNESTLCTRWPKYWSFSFSISPSNEYSGLISFRIDWFDLLAVQGTLKSLIQHCNLKRSILWYSAFLMAQLSHLYMTTGKTIDMTI